jgi:hypothetical protein
MGMSVPDRGYGDTSGTIQIFLIVSRIQSRAVTVFKAELRPCIRAEKRGFLRLRYHNPVSVNPEVDEIPIKNAALPMLSVGGGSTFDSPYIQPKGLNSKTLYQGRVKRIRLF